MAVGLLACHRLRFVRTIFNHISESALPADWIHSMALVMLTVSATGPVFRTFLCLRMKNALEKVWFPPRTDFFVWWSILSVCCSPGTWQHSVNGDSEVCWIKKSIKRKLVSECLDIQNCENMHLLDASRQWPHTGWRVLSSVISVCGFGYVAFSASLFEKSVWQWHNKAKC